MPHLRLEYHDEGDDTDIDESPEQGVHQLHIKRRHDHSQDEKQDDRHEYVHSGGASYPPERQVDEYGDHQYVQDVRKRQVEESEDIQKHLDSFSLYDP